MVVDGCCARQVGRKHGVSHDILVKMWWVCLLPRKSQLQSARVRLSWHHRRSSPSSGRVGIEPQLKISSCLRSRCHTNWYWGGTKAKSCTKFCTWYTNVISYTRRPFNSVWFLPRKMWAVYWLADGSANDDVQSRNFVGQGHSVHTLVEAWHCWPRVHHKQGAK